MEANVRFLPNEYRECADEDGVIQKYKIPVHEPSFKAGIKEVVEWIPELIQQIKNVMWEDDWGVKGVIYENILDSLVERQLQAFKKSKGID